MYPWGLTAGQTTQYHVKAVVGSQLPHAAKNSPVSTHTVRQWQSVGGNTQSCSQSFKCSSTATGNNRSQQAACHAWPAWMLHNAVHRKHCRACLGAEPDPLPRAVRPGKAACERAIAGSGPALLLRLAPLLTRNARGPTHKRGLQKLQSCETRCILATYLGSMHHSWHCEKCGTPQLRYGCVMLCLKL